MMRYISDNTQSIIGSKIREMFNMALKYEDAVSFTIGEPDFTASKEVALAGCKAIMEGKSKYSENAGLIQLRKAISEYLYEEIHMEYDAASEITVTTGAMCGIYQALKVILNPCDEVIVIEPCWTNYVSQITMCGGKAVSVVALEENNFNPEINKIREAISFKTKAIIINSPCNPTGTVFSEATLLEISKIAIEKDLLIISDEVYKHILFDGTKFTSISSLPGMKERVLVVDSFSKTFAMTGWRVGYVAGPSQIISNITKLQENITACVAMPSQYAAIEALKGSRLHLNMMIDSYKKRRDYLASCLEEMPKIKYNKTTGTFYAFVSIRETGMSSEEFAKDLLNKKHVVVVPGTAFGDGGEGYIRISFATSMEEISKGMKLLKEYLKEM